MPAASAPLGHICTPPSSVLRGRILSLLGFQRIAVVRRLCARLCYIKSITGTGILEVMRNTFVMHLDPMLFFPRLMGKSVTKWYALLKL